MLHLRPHRAFYKTKFPNITNSRRAQITISQRATIGGGVRFRPGFFSIGCLARLWVDQHPRRNPNDTSHLCAKASVFHRLFFHRLSRRLLPSGSHGLRSGSLHSSGFSRCPPCGLVSLRESMGCQYHGTCLRVTRKHRPLSKILCILESATKTYPQELSHYSQRADRDGSLLPSPPPRLKKKQ